MSHRKKSEIQSLYNQQSKMNRNTSSPNLSRQSPITSIAGGLKPPNKTMLNIKSGTNSQPDLLSPARAESGQSGSALGSHRSSSVMQSDRQGMLRPQSAKNNTKLLHKKPVGKGGISSGEEATNADGGDISIMDTQKPFLPSLTSGELIPLDSVNTALGKQPNAHENSQVEIQTVGYGGHNATAPLKVNNFMATPNHTPGVNNDKQASNQIKSPSPKAGLSSLLSPLLNTNEKPGEIKVMLSDDLSPMAHLYGNHSAYHNEHMTYYDNDKELRELTLILQKQGQHGGIHIKNVKITVTIIQNMLQVIQASPTGITHLMLEDSSMNSQATKMLSEFLQKGQKLRKLSLVGVRFNDTQEVKWILEGITKSTSIKHLVLNGNEYREVGLQDAFKILIKQNRGIRDLDLSTCLFHPKVLQNIFDSLSSGLIWKLSLRNIQISKIEGAILGYFFQHAKNVHHLDLSYNYGAAEHYEFLRSLSSDGGFRSLTLDEVKADLSDHIAELGSRMAESKRLEYFSIRQTKTRLDRLVDFWKNLLPNRSLKVINFEKNRIGPKISLLQAIADYVAQDDIVLEILFLGHNKIVGPGLAKLGDALRTNRSLKKLILSYNQIDEAGLKELSDGLRDNYYLEELDLKNNQINDIGIAHLSGFLDYNRTLKVLDVSRNLFGPEGLGKFFLKLKENNGLEKIVCQKGKDQDFNAEGGETFECFKILSDCIKKNEFLREIDLGHNTKISKTLVNHNFSIALQNNIFLQDFKFKSSLHKQIEDELKNNQIIEQDIILKKGCLVKEGEFDFKLNLSSKNAYYLIVPAIKVLKCQNIEKADFSEMDNFSDDQAFFLSQFLKVEAPSKIFQKKHSKDKKNEDFTTLNSSNTKQKGLTTQKSVKISQNEIAMPQTIYEQSIVDTKFSQLKSLFLSNVKGITDYGIILIVRALCYNQTLEILDLQGCNLTIDSFDALMILVRDVNLTLYKLTLDSHQASDDINPEATEQQLQSLAKKQTLFHETALKVTKEAGLNQSILKNLKPTQERSEKGLVQVKFTGTDKNIVGRFESVLKVWRIMKPDTIDLTSENLDDKKIVALSQLLIKDVPLIRRLILRRNKFGDEGAEALSNMIKEKLQRFVYLDMSRNAVTNKGASKILDALKINTRVKTLFIDYGNQIKDKKILADIQCEVEANNQIGKEAKDYLQQEKEEFGKLKIQDKGPKYLRCVIKCMDLLQMVEVDLSDNLLEFEDAKKLAESIRLNRPLRKLNLRNNNLCRQSAKVLAEALMLNTNLIKLDLSENNLSDDGVASIVTPLAKQRFFLQYQCQGILEDKKKKLLDKVRPKQEEMGIKFLKLDNNNYSEEALKHVFALLFADREIYVEICPPQQKSEEGENKEAVVAPNTQSETKMTDQKKEQNRKEREGLIFGRYGQQLGIKSKWLKNHRRKSMSPKHKHHHHHHEKDGGKKNLTSGIDPTPYQASPDGPKIPGFNGGSDNNSAGQNKKDDQQPKLHESFASADVTIDPKNISPGKKQRLPSVKIKLSKMISQELLSNITSEETKRGGENNNNMNDVTSNGQVAIQILEQPLGPAPGEEQKETVGLLDTVIQDEQPQKQTRSCLARFIFGIENSDEYFVPAKRKKWWEKTFLYSLWQLYKKDQQYAKMFKCNDNIIRVVENVSQIYITIGLYLSIFFFYFTALLIPMTEGDSCLKGHDVTVFFYYAIYAVCSAVMELVFLWYLERKVGDINDMHVNKFHVWKIVGGQLARVDFFSDVLYMMQMYWCQYYAFLGVGVTFLVLSGFYQFYMLFRLIKKDQQHLLMNIERNCKLAYVTEHHALAVVLDSFSLSNFESVGASTITVPKIISWIKSLSEDLPQFIMQVIYMLFFSDPTKTDRTGVLVSILLGLISFAMSVSHAITAKTSTLDLKKVLFKIEERKRDKLLEIDKKIKEEYVKASGEMRHFFEDLKEKKRKKEEEEDNPQYIAKIDEKLEKVSDRRNQSGKDGVIVLANRLARPDLSILNSDRQRKSPNKKVKIQDQNESGTGGIDSSTINLIETALAGVLVKK